MRYYFEVSNAHLNFNHDLYCLDINVYLAEYTIFFNLRYIIIDDHFGKKLNK